MSSPQKRQPTATNVQKRSGQVNDESKGRRADPLNFKALFGGVLASDYLNRKHENSAVDVNPRQTTIHDAARAGDVAALEYHLQKAPANIRVRDDNDRTPLMVGTCNGHPDIVERLLEEGADPNAQNNLGYTALAMACLFSHDHMVQLLVERGSNVNIPTKNGKTPLIWACELERDLVIKFLIANGADPNAIDDSGWPPTHYACFKGKVKVLKLLLTEGADVNLKKRGGKTVLHVAAYQKNEELVAWLLTLEGIDCNIADDVGWTPLKEAVRAGHNANVVRMLESHGAKMIAPAAKDTEDA